MTVTPQEYQTEEKIISLPTQATEEKFNWQNCWYPVTFIQDLSLERPYSFSLYDEPLVLFRDDQGKLGCLSDRCCHRAAKLSTGQLLDGKIECLYHGWQFDTDGQCVHIPQLAPDAKIPRNACVRSFPVIERQGIIWIWFGQAQAADENTIPILNTLEKEGIFLVDTVIDVPADYTYLIENGIDPAHAAISHDGTELGVSRKNAQPLEMEPLIINVKGLKGRYRRANTPNAPWWHLEFVAPYLISYDFSYEALGIIGELNAYFVPLGKNKTRILVRRYGKNFFPRWFKLKPRWLEHLRQNKVIEEDLFFLIDEAAYVEHSGKSLKEVFLPLKTSDVFVLEYRKWLDKFGSEMPFYDGYTTSKRPDYSQETKLSLDRYSRHIELCSSCRQAYKNTIRLKQILIGVAIALGAIAILTESETIKLGTVLGALVAVILAVMAEKLKTHFERPYLR